MAFSALIVDDERDICELIEMSLIAQEVISDSVYSVKGAISHLKKKNYDVIFCDVRLPDGDGLDLLLHINKHYPKTPVCIMTAHGNMDMAIRALKLGAFDFINKPFELKQLRVVCRAALKESGGSPKQETVSNEKPNKSPPSRVSKKIETIRVRESRLIGDSAIMENVRQMITKVARSQAPVFINGESGTGKEVVARSIHEQSSRKEGPFLPVNCGAIPANLVESEFFGYKKGAFTGANKDTDGLFVAANGGTLFLDEVADLPLAMQVKLLRAIQERAIRPIGGEHEEVVDTRIISATHHNLAERVRSGDFREDLFYRLNVIALDLPPLRERENDVALLSEFLLGRLSSTGDYPKASLSPSALEKLLNYHFPGNVRELENILERALTFMDGDTIEADDIHINTGLHEELFPALEVTNVNPKETRNNEHNADSASPRAETNVDFNFSFDVNTIKEEEKQTETAVKNTIPQETPGNLEQYMQDMEKRLLLKALEDADNNKTKAAEALGISFRAMRYKLKKFGID